MKRFERALGRSLIFAVLFVSGLVASPAVAEETNQASGRDARAGEARPAVQAAAPVVVSSVPAGPVSEGVQGGSSAGRAALDQAGCTICAGTPASVSWNGNSGSFHVDRIVNSRSSGFSGPLDLKVALTAAQPVFGQTISSFSFSSSLTFSPLQAGFQYKPVDSGTFSFFGNTIPAGEYFMMLFLRENVGGTYFYQDFILLDKKVSCNGSGCSIVTPPAGCTEDATTMCLVNGRYKVTSNWKNQYAGGATANLNKAKLTDVTGAFWIANASTYEYMIRVNTATDNGRAWMTILTFTSVEFWVQVTDTRTGQFKEYHSSPGNVTLIYDPSFFVYP
ncbi:MAG: hypothetical protein ABI584_08035 [Acidobacteriota bacterium]